MTRKADGVTQLRAAALLADKRPEAFQKALAAALSSPDARLRADALTVADETTRPVPHPQFLRDPSPSVRVRAAELVLTRIPEKSGA